MLLQIIVTALCGRILPPDKPSESCILNIYYKAWDCRNNHDCIYQQIKMDSDDGTDQKACESLQDIELSVTQLVDGHESVAERTLDQILEFWIFVSRNI